MPPLPVGEGCEVGTGFEPAYTALQAAASPLGQPTTMLAHLMEKALPTVMSGAPLPERTTGLEPATLTLAR